jgi:hypothetical protein
LGAELVGGNGGALVGVLRGVGTDIADDPAVVVVVVVVVVAAVLNWNGDGRLCGRILTSFIWCIP